MTQPSINITSSLLRSSCLNCRSLALQRSFHNITANNHNSKQIVTTNSPSQHHTKKFFKNIWVTSVFLSRNKHRPVKGTASSSSSSSRNQSSTAASQNQPIPKDASKVLDEHKSLLQVATPRTEELFSNFAYDLDTFKGLESDFPCLLNTKETGPEPQYEKITSGYELLQTGKPFRLTLNEGVLPQLEMAYETWGELNADASNAVVVLAGLSASSHAKSHSKNSSPGWWEKFVGPGCAVDTDKYFVICPNNLGSCYGSSGPSSTNMLTGKPYGTTFPIIEVEDMTNAIFTLLDHLGIKKLYAAVGSSLGGMLSLQTSLSFPDRVGRVITISSCARSHPSSIAMRYLQRKCIMSDPNWNNGHYYQTSYPKVGMKLAREIATLTYRSGPEWDKRFGRKRISNDPVSLCPTFSIESYLEHQGESFSMKYDPNSLLYISKAMDMFDVSEGYSSLQESLKRVTCPIMVIGVQTDILFPIWQQRQLSDALHEAGHEEVTFYELNSIYGHDTFLLDLNGVGAAVKGFLETKQKESGWLTKHKTHSME